MLLLQENLLPLEQVTHLALGKFVLRMRWHARMPDGQDEGVRLQELGHLKRVLLVLIE